MIALMKSFGYHSKVKNLKGYLLTSVNICSKTIKETNQPLLICIENIDYLNYIPKLINPVSEIIEQVYEIDFQSTRKESRWSLV